jgi:3'-phosphoadenosine 5'-phosphosulfate sulfotransferase (PAPS reductase)/FAD synthetase
MKKLLISFSGGETSAYMLYYILNLWSKRDQYEIIVLFANTGEENEETLIFIENCSKLFNVKVIWLEAVVRYKVTNKFNNKTFIFTTDEIAEFRYKRRKNFGLGKRWFKRTFTYETIGTIHKVVNYKNAVRGSIIFEQVIMRYGIPNQAYPHCNRELKLQPIKSFLRSIGWKDYYTAIGIRNDEIDRVNAKHKELRLIYPLVTDKPMTKAKINFWWSQQSFRLNLKHYQGNCKTCWKKGFPKLYTIAKETPEYFDSFNYLENKYTNFIPPSRDQSINGITFFRDNKSAKDILEESKYFNGIVRDDSAQLNYQTSLLDIDTESCDIFAECGKLPFK